MSTKKNQAKKDNTVIESIPRSNDGKVGGEIRMNEEVVATIAGLAAKDVDGIHKLGKSRLFGLTEGNPTHGVEAEVGMKEAALDLEVIIDQGCDIREAAKDMRDRIALQVDKMAGRKVVEVNLDVIGIHVPDLDAPSSSDEAPRVV